MNGDFWLLFFVRIFDCFLERPLFLLVKLVKKLMSKMILNLFLKWGLSLFWFGGPFPLFFYFYNLLKIGHVKGIRRYIPRTGPWGCWYYLSRRRSFVRQSSNTIRARTLSDYWVAKSCKCFGNLLVTTKRAMIKLIRCQEVVDDRWCASSRFIL